MLGYLSSATSKSVESNRSRRRFATRRLKIEGLEDRRLLSVAPLAAGLASAACVASHPPASASQVTTTLNLTVSPQSPAPVFGQPITATAVVVPGATSSNTPAGTVSFTVDGHVVLKATVANAAAGVTLPAMAVGTHAIAASYSGDANFLSSTAASIDETVDQAQTTVALTVATTGLPVAAGSSISKIGTSASTTYGQTVVLTATVAPLAPATGDIHGTVEFFDGATLLGQSPVGPQDQAAEAIANLSVNTSGTSHSITATYEGNANNAGSTSKPVTVTVSQAATSTVVVSSVNPAPTGQKVTFTAEVEPANNGPQPAVHCGPTQPACTPIAGGRVAQPTGSVSFSIDGGTAITEPLGKNGEAQLPTSFTATGSHTVTATYLGDGNYLASPASPTFTEYVGETGTWTKVTASPKSGLPGTTAFTFTVTVGVNSGTKAVPVGETVTLVNAANPTGAPLGTGTLAAGPNSTTDQAVIGNITFATAGQYTVIAEYGGDANFVPSQGQTSVKAQATVQTTVALTVAAAGSTSTAGTSLSTTYGQPVALTATVSPVAPVTGQVHGNVKFFDGATLLGKAPVGAQDEATLTVADLGVNASGSSHSITATYEGNANDAGSTSSAVTVTVAQAATATTVVSSVNPVATGQKVTFTAEVQPAASGPQPVGPAAGGGLAQPTGSVQFSIDGGSAITEPLGKNGAAQLPTSFITTGSHTVTATYLGDGNYLASPASPTFTEYVGETGTWTKVTAAPKSGQPGTTTFTFTITVGVNSGTTAVPVGETVTLVDAAHPTGTPLGTGTLAAGSNPTTDQATIGNITFATAGVHNVIAEYGGDTNFAPSHGQTSVQTVVQAQTSVALTVAPGIGPIVTRPGAGTSLSTTYGEPVVLTATVSPVAPATGQVHGNVKFFDGATLVGQAPVGAQDEAILTVADLGVNASGSSHSITATYEGNANDAASTSNPVTVTVAKDGTSTTVVSSANPVAIGQKVTFTADVQGGNSGPQPMVASRSQHTTPVPITGGGVAQPTGSVQFSIDGGSPITEPLGKNGAAQLPTSFTTAGSHTVVATYSGDGNYLPSQGQVSVLVGSVVPPCPWASYSSEPGQEHQDRALAAVFANW